MRLGEEHGERVGRMEEEEEEEEESCMTCKRSRCEEMTGVV